MKKRVKKPVKINDIEFDALISSDNSLEATVPEYAVEEGYSVSDNIILKAETLSLVLFLTDTPVTWRNRSGHGSGHTESVIKKLRELYESRKLCTVTTSERTYKNMAIESMTISKSLETGYAREIPISFRQVRVTRVTTTEISEEYGKSGATEASAGTASTSVGSGGSGGGSGRSKSSKSTAKSDPDVLTGEAARQHIVEVNTMLMELAEDVRAQNAQDAKPQIFGKSTVHVGAGGLVFGGKTGGQFEVNTTVQNYSGTSKRTHSGSGGTITQTPKQKASSYADKAKEKMGKNKIAGAKKN